MKKTLLFSVFIFLASTGFAQNILDYEFNGTEKGKSLPEVLRSIESATDGKIYFLDQWISSATIPSDCSGRKLRDVLQLIFQGTDLSVIAMYPSSIVILKDPANALAYQEALTVVKPGERGLDRFEFGNTSTLSQLPVTISGKISDAKTLAPLAGVSVTVLNATTTATSDKDGSFRLSLQPGRYLLELSQPKYDPKVIDVSAYADGQLSAALDEESILLKEVVIEDKAHLELTTKRIGQTDLIMTDLKRAPALLGEVDIIKQIQILPGVSTVGEAASGFNVRGGSVDQNLILYDGLPVFNSSHIFGFLSSFNPEAIGNVSFLRGGIPSRYGGRTSSVLDIKSKEGNYKKWTGNAGIGMITSNAMVNGPLKKDKTSIVAAVRSTYSNWLVRSLRTDYGDLNKSSVFFYDGNVNVSHILDSRTKLSFTNYFSKDAFRLIGDSTYKWSNFQSSLKLERSFANGTEGEFVLGVSNYGYKVVNDEFRTASELSYRITTKVFRAAFSKRKNIHNLNFGGEVMHYSFQPGKLRPQSAVSNAKKLDMEKQFSVETALYVSDEIEVVKNLTVEGGLRIPVFLAFGPDEAYRYSSGSPRQLSTLVDTVGYGTAEIVKAYSGIEPRLSVRFAASRSSSIKLGFNRIHQYLHLITNTTAVTPVDIWQPSGYYFKPQRADQISLGYFVEPQSKKVGASIEGFYKVTDNVLDFKDGAQLILNNHLETDLLQGKAESYGIEALFTKNTGRLTGTLNYTYSRSFRIIAGPTSAERINNGLRYPSNFDQPHIGNLTWKYNLTRRYFFTGYFTYHTGRPITIPLSAFQVENTYVAYFSGRNQYRIPDYHRLDLAFVIEGNNRRHKRVEGHWVFSVYNVYGRRNPYTVFFKSSENGVPQPYQLAIIGTPLPSISYNLRF